MMFESKKPYDNIPGTPVFDGKSARLGFHLNQFCMSLMTEKNRQRFLSDEPSYLAEWPLSKEQRNAILDRDYARLVEFGGNIYFLAKLGASDGKSVVSIVSSMTDSTEYEYTQMMRAGGRSPEGQRYTDPNSEFCAEEG